VSREPVIAFAFSSTTRKSFCFVLYLELTAWILVQGMTSKHNKKTEEEDEEERLGESDSMKRQMSRPYTNKQRKGRKHGSDNANKDTEGKISHQKQNVTAESKCKQSIGLFFFFFKKKSK